MAGESNVRAKLRKRRRRRPAPPTSTWVSSKKHGSCLKLALITQYTSYGDKDSLEIS